jgi:hypothetical protein
LQPVEQGFANPAWGGAQAFDIGEVQFSAAPFAADDAQAVV